MYVQPLSGMNREAKGAVHFVGAETVRDPIGGDVADRKKQANGDKRAARKRRLQEQSEELQRLKSTRKPETIAEGSKKGTGKGKSKVQAGLQLSFTGTGPCADVPPGGEGKCNIKRAHKCQFCLSPSHRKDSCPLR